MSPKSVPLHSVISFSVINYVVSVRRPRESGEVSFFCNTLSPHNSELKHQSPFFPVGDLYLSTVKVNGIAYYRQSESGSSVISGPSLRHPVESRRYVQDVLPQHRYPYHNMLCNDTCLTEYIGFQDER